MQDAPSRTWREVADQHHSALLNDLAAAVDAQVDESVSQAVAAERKLGDQRAEAASTQVREQTHDLTRRTVTDGLNQTLRLIRQSPSKGGVLKLLAEASAPWAASAAVVLIEDGEARPVAARNLRTEQALPPIHLDEEAAAVNSVIESGDPMTALASAAEISAAFAEALGPDTKCQLLPVSIRGTVTAVLLASGDDLLPGALELLSEAAGMRLETLDPPPAPVLKPLEQPDLVQIATPAPGAGSNGSASAAKSTAQSWNDLTPAEQKEHLAAQRIARVRVAEMRLYHPDELRQGVFAGDIYGALRPQIDQARKDFLQNCLSKSTTMVDYLHVELLRSLAHEDERLLGSNYPGPMV